MCGKKPVGHAQIKFLSQLIKIINKILCLKEHVSTGDQYLGSPALSTMNWSISPPASRMLTCYFDQLGESNNCRDVAKLSSTAASASLMDGIANVQVCVRALNSFFVSRSEHACAGVTWSAQECTVFTP